MWEQEAAALAFKDVGSGVGDVVVLGAQDAAGGVDDAAAGADEHRRPLEQLPLHRRHGRDVVGRQAVAQVGGAAQHPEGAAGGIDDDDVDLSRQRLRGRLLDAAQPQPADAAPEVAQRALVDVVDDEAPAVLQSGGEDPPPEEP